MTEFYFYFQVPYHLLTNYLFLWKFKLSSPHPRTLNSWACLHRTRMTLTWSTSRHRWVKGSRGPTHGWGSRQVTDAGWNANLLQGWPPVGHHVPVFNPIPTCMQGTLIGFWKLCIWKKKEDMNLRGGCGVNPGEIGKWGRSRYNHKTLYLRTKFSKNKYIHIYGFLHNK